MDTIKGRISRFLSEKVFRTLLESVALNQM